MFLSPSVDGSRRALRRAVELPCELITRYLDTPLLYWASDLTPHGLWLETPAPMQVGESVVVSFEPSIWWQQRELTVFAEVTRVMWARDVNERGMGLEFTDITVHEQRALAAWLRGRPPPLPRRRPRSGRDLVLPPPRWLS